MAEIFPDEGLDIVLGVIPKNGANLATLWMGLFTSQSASTVPASTAVLATQTGVTELTGASGYARISMASGTWGAPGAGSGGRQISAGQVTFTATGTWTAVNGFFLADASTNGHAMYYSNFDSLVSRTLLNGDTLKITARWTLLG